MKHQNKRITGFLVVIWVLLPSVCWATLIESETNNSCAEADGILRGPAIWIGVGVMELTAGDMDYFSIPLEKGEILITYTIPLKTLFTVPDTILGLFDTNGDLLALNDNAGSSDSGNHHTVKGSKIEYKTPAEATYYIGITGYDDFDFDGNSDGIKQTTGFDSPHVQTGAYALSVAVMPEPATCMLLVLGSILFLRKRPVFPS